MKRFVLSTILVSTFASQALAGPIGDFNTAYNSMYAQYRAALFQTSAGSEDVATKALKNFVGSWAGFVTAYGQTPPPHLAEDREWANTIADVSKSLAMSRLEVSGGKLAEAHETLEHVRDIFSEMHVRNGIISFSDRMNAYHEEMEHVLTMDVSGGVDAALMREHAAVMQYLANDILDHPPANADMMFAALSKEFAQSVADFLSATRSGDHDAIRAAIKGLKKPYAKLFVKFG